MSVTGYTKTGNKSTTTPKLNKDVFGLEVTSHDLLRYAYDSYLASSRSAQAATLTRGKVRGGGRKPWKQKGTGRARAGSIRSPIWRGGGITFGPQGNENHLKPISKKAKRTALKQALSLASQKAQFKIIDDLTFNEAKTKQAAELMKRLGAERRVLVVVEAKTDDVNRAVRNLDNTKLVSAKYLNVFDLLNADTVVITSGALKVIDQWLGGSDE